MSTRSITALCLAAFACGAQAQLSLGLVRWTEQPQPARIGVGEGVVFRAQAEIDPPHVVMGYQWQRNGVAIPGAQSRELRIDAATASDAGDITVKALTTSPRSSSSQAARLEVVNLDWAPLSGRLLSPAAAPHQPSLTRCGARMVLAWVERVGPVPGVATLRVSRYDGARWEPLGTATLAGTTGHHASDPALGCAWFQAREWIVLAWTESATTSGPKTLHVKRFDDQRWQPVGAPLAAGASGSPARPQLRMASEESDNAGGTMVGRRSLRSYLFNGRMRHEQWDGGQWVLLGDGPLHSGSTPAVALDTVTRPSPAGRALAPLQLSNQRIAVGQTQLVVSSSQVQWQGQWQGLGQPLAAPTGSAYNLVGLALTSNVSTPQAVALWRDGGGGNPSLRSAMLSGQAYLDALDLPNPPAAVAWTGYAAPFNVNIGAFLSAFDPEGYRANCPGKRSLAMALADSVDTRVLRANCPPGTQQGQPIDPMAWERVGNALPRRPASMALKMHDIDHPVLALVENGSIQVLKWIRVP